MFLLTDSYIIHGSQVKMYDLPGEMAGLIHDRGLEKGAGKAKGRGSLCPDSLPWKYERREPQGQEARMDVGTTGTAQIRAYSLGHTYVGSLKTTVPHGDTIGRTK